MFRVEIEFENIIPKYILIHAIVFNIILVLVFFSLSNEFIMKIEV